MKKFVYSMLLAISFILVVGTQTVSAQELLPVESQTQSTIVQNEPVYIDGEYVGTIVVTEEIKSIESGGACFRGVPLSNKTYDVSFIGLPANVGYKVDVYNGRITNAYGLWHWGIIWSIEPTYPVFSDYNSYITGVAKFGIQDFGFHTTFTLRGFIGIDNNFHVTVSAP